MKWIVPVFLAMLAAGCGKESVIGIWKGTIDVREANRDIRRRASRIGNPILEIKSDGTFTLSAGAKVAGKWSESTDGNKLVFTVQSFNGQSLDELPIPVEAREINATISEDRRIIKTDSMPDFKAQVEFMR